MDPYLKTPDFKSITLQIINLLVMQEHQISTQREYYKSVLIQKLRQTRQSFATSYLYLEVRAQSIIQSILSRGEIFGTGLVNYLTKDTIEQKDIGKVIVAAVLDEQGQAEIQKYLHLFADVFIINLMISNSEAVQTMKVSPIRKKLRGFLEISLNFNPFISPIYTANSTRSKRKAGFVESFTSYLTSLPKFHEYLINYSKSQGNSRISDELEQALNYKLGILQRHKSAQYKQSSSPRLKVLLIDRKIDAMSPLIYGYFYGPISKELELFEGSCELTTKSALYSQLFSKDIQQSSQFLLQLSNEKADNKKKTLEKLEIQQIKKAITMFCDQSFSPKQIEIHINSLTVIKDFCKRRAVATALQQTIVNNRSENDEKMSPSKIINRIIEWSSLPLEEYKPSEEDYIKMLMLSYMVNDFWFFQRRIINAGLEGNRRSEVISYLKKIENSYKPLHEKQQGQQRYDLYRHKPAIITEIDDWISNKKQFEQRTINKTSANRQSRYVIAINGPLGYNQACFILRHFKEKQQKVDVSIFCEQLVTTKEYLKYLLPINH